MNYIKHIKDCTLIQVYWLFKEARTDKTFVAWFNEMTRDVLLGQMAESFVVAARSDKKYAHYIHRSFHEIISEERGNLNTSEYFLAENVDEANMRFIVDNTKEIGTLTIRDVDFDYDVPETYRLLWFACYLDTYHRDPHDVMKAIVNHPKLTFDIQAALWFAVMRDRYNSKLSRFIPLDGFEKLQVGESEDGRYFVRVNGKKPAKISGFRGKGLYEIVGGKLFYHIPRRIRYECKYFDVSTNTIWLDKISQGDLFQILHEHIKYIY